MSGWQEQTGGFGCAVARMWGLDEDSTSCKHQGVGEGGFLIGLLTCRLKEKGDGLKAV